MSRKQLIFRILVVLILVGLMAGCSGPTAVVVPTAAPTTAPIVVPSAAATVDPQPTFNAIKTQAAATVIAGLTQNAPSATPPAPATATQPPLPTATAAPSATPLPRATSTATAALIPWTVAPTQAAYSCMVTDFSPKTNVSYGTSADFDAVWVIKNTGKQRWPSTETQFHFVEGTKMQKFGDVFNLKTDVEPNGSYTFGIDLVAPAAAGTYRATWQLRYGNVSICTLSLAVVIK